jgi:hypothetical protein
MIVASCRLITGYSEDFAEVALCHQEPGKAVEDRGTGVTCNKGGLSALFLVGVSGREE